jgi:RNA polymerase sigma factor (sigma-70 family)
MMTNELYGQAYQKGFQLTIRFLLSRGVRPEIADEATQAAWVRGWERLGQLRNDSMVCVWVNSIALNEVRRLIRKEGSYKILLNPPEKTVSIDLAAIDVARILEFCRPCDRSLLEQQYLNGTTTKEIAKQHGVTQTAIRIRLLRARRDAHMKVEQRTSPGAQAA